MPKIKVNERDLSWYYRQRAVTQLTVLMPGVATFGPEDEPAYLTESNFTTVLGTTSVDPTDISYNMAKSLITAGAGVLFWRIPLTNETQATSETSFAVDNFIAKGTGTTQEPESFKLLFTPKSPDTLKVTVNGTAVSGVTLVENTFTITGKTLNAGDKIVAEYKLPDAQNDATDSYTADADGTNVVYTLSKTPIVNTVTVKKNGTTLSEGVTVDGDKVTIASVTKDDAFVISYKVDVEGEGTGVYALQLRKVKEETPGYDILGYLKISARYTGSFGNNLRVSVTGHGSNYRFLIYNKETNALLDSVFINFNNPDSEYYYETVNNASEYLYFELKNTTSSVLKPTDIDYLYSVITGTPVTTAVSITLTGGGNGIYSKEAVETYLKSDKALEKINMMADPLGFTFNAICSAGYNGTTEDSPTAISDIDDRFIYLAEKRGTAFYLVDGNQKWDAETFYNYTDLPAITDINNNIKIISTAGFNTSYAAAFGPWVSAQYLSNGVTRMLPGSYAFLVSWAKSLSSGNPMYLAPAGVKRSVLDFVYTTEYPIGSAILDLWQNHDAYTTDGHKINPIMNLYQYGYVIYGNSTLLQDSASGQTSMLQSLSTRILANLIKQRAYDISLTLQFDQISNDLFVEFKTNLGTYMDILKYGGALYDYEIVADYQNMTLDDLNSRTVPVSIRISPNPAAENFTINLEISQAGVSFNAETEQDVMALA